MPARSEKITVIYHHDCPDGFGAAYAAWKKFGNKAAYVGGRRGGPPENIKGERVYMLDFTYHMGQLRPFMKANVVTSIDHHETTEEETKATVNPSFSLKNAGCVLAWKYFHPGKPVPLLLKYVEDLDLWALKLPKAREVRAFLEQYPFDFKTWDKLMRDFEKPAFRRKAIAAGELLRAHTDILAARIADGAELVEFCGHKVYAVNAAHVLTDEVGHLLYGRKPPFAIVWQKTGNLLRISLRGNGRVDLSKMAEKFGGGGHPGSSGITRDWKKGLPWKPVGTRHE